MIDFLAKYDPNTVDVFQAKFTNAIRLVRRRSRDIGAPTNDLLVIRIDVLDPLKQVYAQGTAVVTNEVNRGIVAPNDGAFSQPRRLRLNFASTMRLISGIFSRARKIRH